MMEEFNVDREEIAALNPSLLNGRIMKHVKKNVKVVGVDESDD